MSGFGQSDFTSEYFSSYDNGKYEEQPELFSSFLQTANDDLKYRGAKVGSVDTLGLDYITNIGIPHGIDIGDQLKGVQNSKISVKDPFTVLPVQKTVSNCPIRPFSLMKTHFMLPSATIISNINDIQMTIERCLSEFPTIDFTYFPNDYMWKGKYIRGSSFCEIYIHLYAEVPPSKEFIVEANRVKGDAKPFFNFYREFKSIMLNTSEENRVCNDFTIAPMLNGAGISEDQFLKGVQPIFNMCQEIFYEARLEGAKMLCDLAEHESHFLQHEECKKNVVLCLSKLISDDFECVRQHAIIAFSKFSEMRSYADAMIKSAAFAIVFSHVDNAPEPVYETVQIRRECAYAFANLCGVDPKAVLVALAPLGGKLDDWRHSVESLVDARMQKQAIRARDYLRRK